MFPNLAARTVKNVECFGNQSIRSFGPTRQPFLMLKMRELFGYGDVDELIK
jgi:hypothetical protein